MSSADDTPAYSDAVAVLSDIHANAYALDAVLDFIDRQGIQTIVNMGDLVGYGPHPRQCFERVMGDERFVTHLLGNHDRNLLYLLKTPDMDMTQANMNPKAAKALSWTRTELYGDHPWDIGDEAEYIRQKAAARAEAISLDEIEVTDPLSDRAFFQRQSTPKQLRRIKQEIVTALLSAAPEDLRQWCEERERLQLGRAFHQAVSQWSPFHVDAGIAYTHDNLVDPGDDRYTMDPAQTEFFKRDKKFVSIEDTCQRTGRPHDLHRPSASRQGVRRTVR